MIQRDSSRVLDKAEAETVAKWKYMLHIKIDRFIMLKKTSSQTGKRRLPVSSFYLSREILKNAPGLPVSLEMKLDFMDDSL